MRYPLAFLGLAAQVPLQNPIESPVKVMVDETPKFAFKEAPDIFSPKDLVSNCLPPQIESYTRFRMLRSNWDAPDEQSLTPKEILHWFHTASIHWRKRSKLELTSGLMSSDACFEGVRNPCTLFPLRLTGRTRSRFLCVSLSYIQLIKCSL